MMLPGFTARTSLKATNQTEFKLASTHTNASMGIMPSQWPLCSYYEPGCRRMCRAAGKRGEDFDFCMCDCLPECFCEFQ
jgi:hypothetical protein